MGLTWMIKGNDFPMVQYTIDKSIRYHWGKESQEECNKEEEDVEAATQSSKAQAILNSS